MCRKDVTVFIAVVLVSLFSVNAQAELVAEFNLNGNTLDTSGNGYTGGAGGLVGETHYVDGKFGQALDFDGAGDFIQLMVHWDDNVQNWVGEGLYDQTAFSVAMWIKMDAYPTADTDLLASREWYWGDMNLEFHTFFGLDKVFLINVQGAVPAENPLGNITPDMLGQWTHIAATYDAVAGEAFIYINGVKGAKATIDPSRRVDIGNYTLGGNAAGNFRYFDGQIDEVKLYNHALSQIEVNGLVPEPATMSLLVLGLPAILMRRRRGN